MSIFDEGGEALGRGKRDGLAVGGGAGLAETACCDEGLVDPLPALRPGSVLRRC